MFIMAGGKDRIKTYDSIVAGADENSPPRRNFQTRSTRQAMVHALRKRAGIDNILGSRESLAPEGGVASVRGS